MALLFALGACGGATTPTSEQPGTQGGEAAGEPTPTTIPMGPPRPAGAVGTKPCSPLAQPTAFDPAAPTKTVLVGRTSNHTIYIVDEDTARPGRHRVFIQRGVILERHALSEDEAPNKFVIDRGLPNQIALTATTIQGAGTDGPFIPALPEQLAVINTFANDAPAALAYGTYNQPGAGPNHLFVVGPIANGVIGVPRIFYGPSSKIEERAFLGFSPSDSGATSTPATAVTFDLDGTPTTMPTLVTRAMQGLINGFSTGSLRFFCF